MPEPIRPSSSVNFSYDAATEPPPGASRASPAAAAPVTGKDWLVEKYGSSEADCTKHLLSAAVSLAVTGTGVAVGIVTAPSGVGAAAGMVSAAGGIIKAAAELASYLNCEDENERLRRAAEQCNAQGGALFAGLGDSAAICVVPRE